MIDVSVINGVENVKHLLSDNNPDFGYTPISHTKSEEFTPGTNHETNFVSVKWEDGSIICHARPYNAGAYRLTVQRDGRIVECALKSF